MLHEIFNLTETSLDGTRNGICHERMGIVRVKSNLPGVKKSFEHTLFDVNLLLVSILNFLS